MYLVQPYYIYNIVKNSLKLRIYLEITVKFVKNPTAIESNEKNRIALSGCAYESTVNLNANAYWLINGNRKIKTAYWSGGSSPYHFPYMQIYEKGYYQCGLYDPFRMKTPVLSGNASVTYFQGLYCFELNIYFLTLKNNISSMEML